MQLKLVLKIWLETDNRYVFGEGAYKILSAIRELGSLSSAAKTLGMSYRHAWGIVKTVERRFGKPILKTYKGGKLGGGGAELTEDGVFLLMKYMEVKEALMSVSEKLEQTDIQYL